MNLKLNPTVAYKKKDSVYAIYVNFSYIFFSGIAAEYLDQILTQINNQLVPLIEVPQDFIDYLIKREILTSAC